MPDEQKIILAHKNSYRYRDMQIEFGVGNTKLSKVLKYYKENNAVPEKPKFYLVTNQDLY